MKNKQKTQLMGVVLIEQVRKMTPGARNNTKVVVKTPTVKAPTNLNRAVAKMKVTQAKLKANKNAKVVKMINKK